MTGRRVPPAIPVAIHAPLAEGDADLEPEIDHPGVAIHAPLAEGDSVSSAVDGLSPQLRSTPPSRRATRWGPRLSRTSRLRSTPPSRRATLSVPPNFYGQDVAIHAPLAEGDAVSRAPRGPSACCDPRPPRGGRHRVVGNLRPLRGVAIHAPLAEGDGGLRDQVLPVGQVAIHAPLAEGDGADQQSKGGPRMLRSTPPSRRATRRLRAVPPSGSCDPRPPRGGRRRDSHL